MARSWKFDLQAARGRVAVAESGVERALALMEAEIVRDMKLMGKTSVDQLTRENLRFR